ncbi:hypothetical protein EV421DRAFT_1912566 [Armillaria borealis]|uniref:Uncharacterized protein n=1 Tax=Armillaria borealis TaxID=47425 RepID=A0AA39IUJ1_9AGAR|nr:hypothetical protein EV421DRAFT_1912566 [Armillaria borealis]
MLDRDEAERLPVVIPQEDIDNDPKAFAWYEGPQGGGFTVSYQFKKYRNRPVNETPMGYLHYIVDKCNEYTKNIHSAFFDAIDEYFEGLMEYAMNHYAEFVIPFGTKHRGKRLQQCRDKPWMQWTTRKPSLTKKYTVYFTAVRYFLDDPRHYTANRDIGELLSATEYEDDLDLVESDSDDESEMNSFIDDGDIEDEREEEESSEAADESEASSSTEESTQPSDAESSQSYVSDGFDSEPYVQTPPRKIPLNGTASLGTAYRLRKRRDSSSPSPELPLASSLRKRRRASPDFDAYSALVSPTPSKVNSASKGMLGIVPRYPISLGFSIASPRKGKFSSVDSSDHPDYSDVTEKNEPEARQQSRSRKTERPETRQRQTRNDGKSSPIKADSSHRRKRKRLASDVEDFISSAGGEEEDGSDEYIDNTTENDTSMDMENSFEPRQLRPRKPPPSDGPCVLEEILSAKSSLSSIATELSSGVIALLSDNEQESSVIVISSDSESEQDDQDGSKGQSQCTRRKRGLSESDPDPHVLSEDVHLQFADMSRAQKVLLRALLLQRGLRRSYGGYVGGLSPS